MKVQLTASLEIMPGVFTPAGSVVQVSDSDGASLVALGHTEVDKDTPLRKNPALYALGCSPLPVADDEVRMARIMYRSAKKE